ncbi:MAG TPA: O-antigen ligase family protein [Vicinamibacterales bacterium]|nr:O-antigen ligase family protein [Vicinamibacterales bacterium]
MQAIIAWTAFAFGGVYASTLALPGVLLLILAAAYRPALLRRGPNPQLDLAILVALGVATLQILPLPRTLVRWFSPGAMRVADALSLVDAGGALPVSINLPHSAAAALIFAGVLLVFFTARQLFDAGGVRAIGRGVAVAGLVLAAVAIAQDATGRGMMYWRWRPLFERAHPFGPFVNRNHFGTWAIMAITLTIGYLAAHASAHAASSRGSWRLRVVAALDFRAALLLGAAALMIVATVLSLSRSSMLGLAAAVLFGGWLSQQRTVAHGGGSRQAVMVGVLALFAMALVLLRVDLSSIADRLASASTGLGDRALIWRGTLPILRDFWFTGTGVGTYQTAMAVYQRTNPGLIYNQAHNHYLQVAAEGGVLLCLPVTAGLFMLWRDGAAALRKDRSGMYWLRAGAASGLFGVAVQSTVETGLLTPANAVLAAVMAAILVHVPGRYGPPRVR